jgi:hypothetical protein
MKGRKRPRSHAPRARLRTGRSREGASSRLRFASAARGVHSQSAPLCRTPTSGHGNRDLSSRISSSTLHQGAVRGRPVGSRSEPPRASPSTARAGARCCALARLVVIIIGLDINAGRGAAAHWPRAPERWGGRLWRRLARCAGCRSLPHPRGERSCSGYCGDG